MIKCARCQTENETKAQYCDECGSPLRNAEKLDVTKQPAGSTEIETDSENAAFVVEPIVAGAPWRHENGNSGSSSSPSPANRLRAKLVIERGQTAGKEFLFDGTETLVGRWDADNGIFPDVDLDADDPEAKVSRRHARILCEAGGFYIEDLGSTNGTFINRGRRLLPGNRQILEDGDEIIVGKTFLRFKMVS